MRRLVSRLTASALFSVFTATAGAQQIVDPSLFDVIPDQQVAPTILTIDVDRLFAQTQFGARIFRNYNEGRAALAAENPRIADALREEEIALAAQRNDMAPDVFRTEAEAFDAKAQAIRRAQDAKERALDDALNAGRDQFFVLSRPILGELMVERGAFALLDRRSAFLSLSSIDVTVDAIARIDETIGDGSEIALPAPTATDSTDPDNTAPDETGE